ncbi:integrase, catalytic region, zinc finger, CCHC-type containing protein [Tanacetum coccineum]
MTEDSGFAVPVFSPGDDPIAYLNKAIAFLTDVASSRSGRQGKINPGLLRVKGNVYSFNKGNAASGQQSLLRCYNYKVMNIWLGNALSQSDPQNGLVSSNEKAMLARRLRKLGHILDESNLAFLADPGFQQSQNIVSEVQQDSMILFVIEQILEQMINHVNNWEKANKEQNLINQPAEPMRYSKEMVKTFKQRLNIDLSSREKMIDSQMDDMIRENLVLKEQIDSLEQNLSKQIKEKESLLETFSVFKNKSKEKEDKYQENEIDLEKKIKELDNIICKVGQSAQTVHMLTEPQAFYDNTHKQALEVPSELPKVSLVNASLKKLKFYLTQFDSVVKKRTTSNALEEDTCLNAITHSSKKIDVTPMNNVKKVRFTEPITSSSKTEQDEVSNNCYVDVKHSLLNANFEILCAFCNKSMFDDVHDQCLLDFVHKENNRSKSAKKHKKKNIWKPTGHVFTKVGFKWKPTGRIFTIVGKSCPLTRITSTNVVPPKQITPHSVEIQKPEIKVYSRKPKNVRNLGSSKVAKIVESKNVNHSDPNQFWGSNAQKFTSYSFSYHDMFVQYYSGILGLRTIRFGNDQIARIMGYGDYQLGNFVISRVYYVKGLGHNLFLVRQFCDVDLEVAFRKNTCFIRNLEGVDLLLWSRDTNLCTISLDDMLRSYLIILLSKASKTKSWLWHRQLSYLNFDNETEFVNQTLHEWYENVGISHQTSAARTPQQNVSSKGEIGLL